MLLFGTSLAICTHVKNLLKARYRMKDLGKAKRFIGINITRNRTERILKLDQSPYLLETLRQCNMHESNSVHTPLDPHTKILVPLKKSDQPGPDLLNPADTQLYQKILGKIMYAVSCSRPDMALTASFLGRFNASPTHEALSAAKRTLRYVQRSKLLCLTYGGATDVEQLPPAYRDHPPPTHRHDLPYIIAYSDADFANEYWERRSTSAYLFLLNGAAVSWKSLLQHITARSTAEAEYLALGETSFHAIWLGRL